MNTHLCFLSSLFFVSFRNERKHRDFKDYVTEWKLLTVSALLNGGNLNEFLQAEAAREIPRHALDVAKRLLPLSQHVQV